MIKNYNSAIADFWDNVKKELFTPEEIAKIEAGTAFMEELIEAHRKKTVSQKRPEEAGGVSPPVIPDPHQ